MESGYEALATSCAPPLSYATAVSAVAEPSTGNTQSFSQTRTPDEALSAAIRQRRRTDHTFGLPAGVSILVLVERLLGPARNCGTATMAWQVPAAGAGIRRSSCPHVAAMMRSSHRSAELLREINSQTALELEWRRAIRRNEREYVAAMMLTLHGVCQGMVRRIFFWALPPPDPTSGVHEGDVEGAFFRQGGNRVS